MNRRRLTLRIAPRAVATGTAGTRHAGRGRWLEAKDERDERSRWLVHLEIGLIGALCVLIAVVKMPLPTFFSGASFTVVGAGMLDVQELVELLNDPLRPLPKGRPVQSGEERADDRPEGDPAAPSEIPAGGMIAEAAPPVAGESFYVPIGEPTRLAPPRGRLGTARGREAEEAELSLRSLYRVRSAQWDLGNNPDVMMNVEEMPELIGGLEAVRKVIRYPERCRLAGVEGRVVILFVVDERGRVVSPQLVAGIGGSCDQEAMRAVAKLQFAPGRHKGRTVNVLMTMPIRFELW